MPDGGRAAGQLTAPGVTATGDTVPAGSVVYTNSGKYWVFTPDQKLPVASGNVTFADYTFNSAVNPGPLAELPNNPASNFFGGQYNSVSYPAGTILYRAGVEGQPTGNWFTTSPAESITQVRINLAVKPQWIDSATGILQATSPIDTIYGIRFPNDFTAYGGPVGYQDGVYLGGQNFYQLFVPGTRTMDGLVVVFKEPLK